VHQKMALCRRKDGLGGHHEYAQERNAREILEHLGEKADDRSSRFEEASLKGRLEDTLQEASRHKADAETGKVKSKFTMTWIRQTRRSSEFITRMLLGLWRAKSRVGPTGSESQSVREVAEEALSVKKEAAAAKTAGQQDNRSGPVIGGPGRLAAVFRWAMPRLAMRHRADAEQYKQALEDASRHRADSEAGKVALTWVRQTNAHMGLSTAFRVGKWASRAKSRAATAPAPVASASRPEPSASKYTVAPGEKEDHDAQKAQAEGDVEVTDLM